MQKVIWLGELSALKNRVNAVSGYWDHTVDGQSTFKMEGGQFTYFENTKIIWFQGERAEFLAGLISNGQVTSEECLLQTTQTVEGTLIHIKAVLVEQLEILKSLHILTVTLLEQLKNDRNHP